MRRSPILSLLLLAAAALAGCDDDCIRPRWGKPLSYKASADVREMLVSGSDRKLHAYRQAAGDPFQIVIAYKTPARVERCRSGPGFARFLEAMATVQVVRRSWHGVDSLSADWFVVELWDGGAGPGIPHRLRPPTSGYPWTVMQWCFGSQYLVDVDPAIWESLKSGCASLGAESPGEA